MKTIWWVGVCDVENSVEHNQTSREGTLVILKSLQMFTDIQTVQLETVSSGLSTNIKHQTSNTMWFHAEPTFQTQFIDA